MRLHFCRSNDIGGLLIRLFTFSNWNHVAIEFNGTVYEAMTGSGVRKVPASHFRWDEMEVVNVAVPEPLQAVAFLESQLGKKYDWMALVALPFRTTWQSPHRWFCSELVAKALAVGGVRAFSVEKYRITPRDLWILKPWLARAET
ncbi:hypothetical protein [Marinobacter nauticus]|uniref:Permuted papain-like amidase enzyme, YaeF/YiiX, C92 family n=1 Tax=Marinobacter nauticus TaxID=2743 RepID=A0A1M2V0Y0_MARNT|nr:hypothetical protein [Marinobacter nauticus]OJT01241.1 hypothetical protein BEE62_14930 [Marinobacter nauticus]